MIFLGFYFSGLSNRIMRKKYLVTGDWSQSKIYSTGVGKQFVPIGITTACWYKLVLNRIKRYYQAERASHSFLQSHKVRYLLSSKVKFFFFFSGQITIRKDILWARLIIHSTLGISNFKGLYETLRDIRTSTYQIF